MPVILRCWSCQICSRVHRNNDCMRKWSRRHSESPRNTRPILAQSLAQPANGGRNTNGTQVLVSCVTCGFCTQPCSTFRRDYANCFSFLRADSFPKPSFVFCAVSCFQFGPRVRFVGSLCAETFFVGQCHLAVLKMLTLCDLCLF